MVARFNVRRAVIDACSRELLEAVGAQTLILDSTGDDQRLGGDCCSIGHMKDLVGILAFHMLDGGWNQDFGAEPGCLGICPPGEVGATYALREAEVVLDQR